MMAMHRTIRLLTPLSLAALAAAGSSSPPRAHELDGSYTYSQYTSHFNKSYSADEYELRSEIFERNFRKILDHNAARVDRAGIGGYLMGVNEFTDRETTEVKLGWNKLMHFAWRDQFRKNELLIEEKASVSAERFLRGAKSYSLPFDFEIEPISSLPASVDWTDIVNPAPSQGCGDCWAYAATACIESHLAMATANLMQLSNVNMLECTPNPERCGGDGGCDGATCEEAFNYIADMTANNTGGMYRANDISQGESCSYAEASPVVGIDGWTLLPSNNYTVTMNALAKVGPLAIAVAAGSWQAYESGVLSTSASTVNHAVLLVGYGTDEITGEDYYLIRNSWGSGWGENGYIRIKRGEDDSANCVMDDEPLLGIGCELDDNGNQVDVQPVQVCGESAVLFDVAYPVGVHMLD